MNPGGSGFRRQPPFPTGDRRRSRPWTCRGTRAAQGSQYQGNRRLLVGIRYFRYIRIGINTSGIMGLCACGQPTEPTDRTTERATERPKRQAATCQATERPNAPRTPKSERPNDRTNGPLTDHVRPASRDSVTYPRPFREREAWANSPRAGSPALAHALPLTARGGFSDYTR